MSTIALRGLTKIFGDLTAVKAVDLDVGAGEVVCLLGPSGCGKTTTLRMIAGLESATAGDVVIGGRRVNHLPPRARNVAMVFQFYALYPTLTARENLAYPLHADRLSSTAIADRVARVSTLLGLEGVLDRRPGQLAEGEKQRVAVGRAIIRDPSCFLFDEPLSRLDVQLREIMRGQIKEVLGGLRKATVIVTHDQLEALTMADRIAVMREGVIEQVDTPHEIFTRPATLFVASFIGTPQMNLLPATLLGPANGDARFRTGGQETTIWVDPAVQKLPAGSQVTLGIRPRSLELIGTTGSAEAPNAMNVSDPASIAARVDLIEPMGAETLIHLVEDGRDLRVVVDHRVQVEIGSRVRVRFRPGQTHVFDSSERLVRS
jgi:ABC-type sugar transport system ATPase subunit